MHSVQEMMQDAHLAHAALRPRHMSALMVHKSRVLCVHVADVAFEMSMNDNLLTGTVPAELQYLPLRVSSASFSSL